MKRRRTRGERKKERKKEAGGEDFQEVPQRNSVRYTDRQEHLLTNSGRCFVLSKFEQLFGTIQQFRQ
jgi:hypothetical protein